MENEPQSKWLPILYFMITGIVFGASLYLISGWAARSEARAQVGAPSARTVAASPQGPRLPVVLRRDVKTRLGKVDLVYRGVEGQRIKLDVFIRDLDPDYPYRREISYRSAKQGFRLGGVRFELISAGYRKAKLVWIRGG